MGSMIIKISFPMSYVSLNINGTLVTINHDYVVVSNIFYFHPYLGKIVILTNIFQMG